MKRRCKEQRCHTEREILTLMKHPNIVRCFGTFKTQKFLYFIMEYVASPPPSSVVHSALCPQILHRHRALQASQARAQRALR